MRLLLNTFLNRLGWDLSPVSEARITDPFSAQRELIKKHQPVIFDVGANVGNTVIRYKSLFPDSHLHAFEPFPQNFQTLSNRCGDLPNVFLHPFGLAERSGQRTFCSNTSSSTNSIFETSSASSAVWDAESLATQERISLPFETIDGFCKKQGIEHIDILKLDVQGSEMLVLAGAEQMLKSYRVDLVFLEILVAPTYTGQPPFFQIPALLHDHGYHLHNLYSFSHRGGRLRQMDGLFVREATQG